MRKTYLIIATLILSGFMLMSLSTPAMQNSTNKGTELAATASDTLSWKLLGQIKYIKKASNDYPEGVMYPVINPTLKAKNKSNENRKQESYIF